jgi:hypothetical protein
VIALNLPGRDPIKVKDRDDLKKSLFSIIDKFRDAEIGVEEKVKKLQALFEVNSKTLNGIGPDLYLDVKNKIGDVIRGLLA